jgi:acetate kinase
LGVRRFGLHGLSHGYAWRRTIELMGHSSAGIRVVTCHLGAGASLAAVTEGRSVDTTMGFTPLEGLVMATRSGTIDPGQVLWLAQEEGIPLSDIARALEHESGLYALAGSSDMPEIEAMAA